MIDVDSLSGRDLDLAIAVNVLNYIHYSVPKDAKGENAGFILVPQGWKPYDSNFFPPLGKLHEGYIVPQWHKNLDDTLRLAKEVGYTVMLKVDRSVDVQTLPEVLLKRILKWYLKHTSG